MFVISERTLHTRKRLVVARGVGGHIIVGRGKCVLDTTLQHRRLPELGLEIHLRTIDIYCLTTVDVQSELGVTHISRRITGLLKVVRTIVVAVVIYIDSQFTLFRLRESVCIVDVSRVLRCLQSVARLGYAVDGVIALDGPGVVASGDNRLADIHIRHLQDKSQSIGGVDVPVVAYLQHIILETKVVTRSGVVLQRRGLPISL